MLFTGRISKAFCSASRVLLVSDFSKALQEALITQRIPRHQEASNRELRRRPARNDESSTAYSVQNGPLTLALPATYFCGQEIR
jgi:hypothetical protein